MARAKNLMPGPTDVPSGLEPFPLSAAEPPFAAPPEPRDDPRPLPGPTAAQPDDVAALRAQVNALSAQVTALLSVLGGRVGPQAATVADEHARVAEEAYKRTLADVSRSNTERSQAVVGATIPPAPGDSLFDVQLHDKPEPTKADPDRRVAGVFPLLRVPAARDSDARGRYAEVCGIVSTGEARWHLVKVGPATPAAVAA